MLKKVQAVSGVVFAVFVFVHLLNTWLAATGAAIYNGFQGAVRLAYQAPLIEALLLSALVVHIITGITRIVREPKRQLTTRARWHRYAGFFLLFFIGGHIFAVRGPSWFAGVYPGFEGLAFSIDFAPYYFFPYYFLLGVAGFYHATNGVSVALGRLGVPLGISGSALRTSTAVAAVLMVTALLGFAGAFFDVGDVYNSEFAKLAEAILRDFTS